MIAAGIDSLSGQLERLRAASSDMEALAVISVEGLIIACSADEARSDDRLGNMSAAMLALGERIADELERGPLEEVMIKGDRGLALLMTLDEQAVLCALACHEANLGLLYLDMRRAKRSLRESGFGLMARQDRLVR